MSNIILTPTSNTGVPVGAYTADFVGVEAVNNDFGDGFKWTFKVASGEHAGQTCSRFTGKTPSLKNACGKILGGLLGKPLQDGVPIDVSTFIGKRYLVIVAQGQQGGTRVETVAPAPAPAPPATPIA